MAHPVVCDVLAHRGHGAAPKLIAAVGDYADGIGGAPQEIIDVVLAERFGWTWQELDEQDMSLVLPAVSAANIHAAVKRVHHWLDVAGAGHQIPMPSPDDMKILAAVKAAQKERDA